MYQWSQLADICSQNNLRAHLAVMSSGILRVGVVEKFCVRHQIVRIEFVVSRPSSMGGSYAVGLTFDDRLHLLRACRKNKFYTHGIAGLGSVVFTIIDRNRSHAIVPSELPRLRTGWSYELCAEEESNTGDNPPHLKPVN